MKDIRAKGWKKVYGHLKGLEDGYHDAVFETAERIMKKSSCELMFKGDDIKMVVFFGEETGKDIVKEHDFIKLLSAPLIFYPEADPNEPHNMQRVMNLRKAARKIEKLADKVEQWHKKKLTLEAR